MFKGELNARNSDIGYVLSKQSLTCKDIYLFNLRRSDTERAYGVLESLKDGYFLSNKYHTKILKIKSPNTVIVFSNSSPRKSELSADRWKIYNIIEDRLVGLGAPYPGLMTISQYTKKQKTHHRSESEIESEPEPDSDEDF